jgi:glycosyltransferase involved in cell wall biosynthesis
MISFVIPAHNEEACLPATLDALVAAAKQVAQPYEVIVVNDASTDRTALIASERGARVIDVQHRQIAATRNSGARESLGDVLFFVDADTRANAEAIRGALSAIAQGAVGGGCVFHYDGWVPLWARVLLPIGNAMGRLLKVVGGGFLFCRRSDFLLVGGFCEQYFAAEDVAFVKALKRRGRFVIPRTPVLTSNRKLRAMSLWRGLSVLFRFVMRGPESYRSREGLGLWYGPEARDEKAEPGAAPNGGPATSSRNSGATEGPPSVS